MDRKQLVAPVHQRDRTDLRGFGGRPSAPTGAHGDQRGEVGVGVGQQQRIVVTHLKKENAEGTVSTDTQREIGQSFPEGFNDARPTSGRSNNGR